MIQLVLFLALGAGFLFLLFWFARKSSSRPEGSAEALIEARQALGSLRTGLLPADMVQRIFARDDLEFVNSTCPEEIRRLFLRERKRIALSWVAQLRKQVLSLRASHSRQSRRSSHLDARTEIALALNFLSLLLICRVLQLTFFVSDPYAVPTIVRKAIGAAGDVCAASERSLAFLGPSAGIFGETADSARDRAAV